MPARPWHEWHPNFFTSFRVKAVLWVGGWVGGWILPISGDLAVEGLQLTGLPSLVVKVSMYCRGFEIILNI